MYASEHMREGAIVKTCMRVCIRKCHMYTYTRVAAVCVLVYVSSLTYMLAIVSENSYTWTNDICR